MRLFVEAQRDRRDRRRAGRMPRRCAAISARRPGWSTGSTRRSRACSARQTIPGAASSPSPRRPRRTPRSPDPRRRSTLAPTPQAEAAAVVERVARGARERRATDVAMLVRARTHLDADPARAARRGHSVCGGRPRRAGRAAGDARPRRRSTHALAAAGRPARVAVGAARAVVRAHAAPTCSRSQRCRVGESRIVGRPARPRRRRTAALSQDGRERFARSRRCSGRCARSARPRRRCRARVRGAWLALGGPATLDEPLDLVARASFFALLAEHERAGDVPDWPAFVDASGRSCAPSPLRRRAGTRRGAGDDAAQGEGPRVRHGRSCPGSRATTPRGERGAAALAPKAQRHPARIAARARRRRRARSTRISRCSSGGGRRGARAPALRRLHARQEAAAPDRGAGDAGRRGRSAAVEGADRPARRWPGCGTALRPPQPPARAAGSCAGEAPLRAVASAARMAWPRAAALRAAPGSATAHGARDLPVSTGRAKRARSVGVGRASGLRADRAGRHRALARQRASRALRARLATELAHEGVAAGELDAAVERVQTALRRALARSARRAGCSRSITVKREANGR